MVSNWFALVSIDKMNNFSHFSVLDIVFFIFLYQRWIYKVDKKRVNEFGISGEMEEERKPAETPAAIEGSAPVDAPPSSPKPKEKPKKDKKRD